MRLKCYDRCRRDYLLLRIVARLMEERAYEIFSFIRFAYWIEINEP